MIYTGIDLVEIERFKNLKPEIKTRFSKRVFSEEERAYIGNSDSRAAGIFAAKEATAKALGCGIGPISWQDITISHTDEKQPILSLHNNAKSISDNKGIHGWSVSIAHTKRTAAAVAIGTALNE